MNNNFQPVTREWIMFLGALVAASSMLSGCKSTSGGKSIPSAQSANRPAPAAAPSLKAIRINAGATAPYSDPDGNTWLPDQGFTDGRTVDRGDIAIAGTKISVIYRTEHYGMTAFSQALPNGAYTVRLHFAETYPQITGKGQRVFTIKVQDKEIKDFDVFARAGAPRTAWVETVPVAVSNGKLDITFTPGVQNPEINGIEIIPR